MTEVVMQDATLGASAHNDATMPPKAWTENDVLRVLWRHFVAQSWAAIPQVTVALNDLDADMARLGQWERNRASLAAHDTLEEHIHDATDRRIDLLLARPGKKNGLGDLETMAVEVKVTRADFLNDIRNPGKQAPWRAAATRHSYAVPAGLVAVDEVPEGSGLIYVKHGLSGYGEAEFAKRAPYRRDHAPQPPRRVLVALMHRISTLEADTRGWGYVHDAAGTEQEVRAALKATQKRADAAERAKKRAEEARDSWKVAHALATPGGHPCKWCGKGLKPLNPTGGWFRSWRHVDAAMDGPCADRETSLREVQALADYANASEKERDRQVREAHYKHPARFNPQIDAEPWRAFIPRDYKNQLVTQGPFPADVGVDPLPEED